MPKTKATSKQRQSRSPLSRKLNFNSPSVIAVIALVIAVGGYFIYRSLAAAVLLNPNWVLITTQDTSSNIRYFAVNTAGSSSNHYDLTELTAGGHPLNMINPSPSKFFSKIVGGNLLGGGVLIYDVASGTETPLTLNTSSTAVASQPTYSPNGAHLAYMLIVGSSIQLYTANPDGTNIRPVVAGSSHQISWFKWQPNIGGKFLYVDGPPGGGQLHLVNSDGSNNINIGPADGIPVGSVQKAAWAPDGSKFAVDLFPPSGSGNHVIVEYSATGKQLGTIDGASGSGKSTILYGYSPDRKFIFGYSVFGRGIDKVPDNYALTSSAPAIIAGTQGTSPGSDPVWLGDGWIVYQNSSRNHLPTPVKAVRSGVTHTIFQPWGTMNFVSYTTTPN